MKRNYDFEDVDIELPWQVNFGLAAVGILVAGAGFAYLEYRMVSPILQFAQIMGITVDIRLYLENGWPLAFIGGGLIGLRTVHWLRSSLIGKIAAFLR